MKNIIKLLVKESTIHKRKQVRRVIINYKNAYEEMKRLYDKLQQENKKYKEVIDKAIEFTNKKWGTWCTHHLEYMTELQNILKEVSE